MNWAPTSHLTPFAHNFQAVLEFEKTAIGDKRRVLVGNVV
jgi:hypothetical protein